MYSIFLILYTKAHICDMSAYVHCLCNTQTPLQKRILVTTLLSVSPAAATRQTRASRVNCHCVHCGTLES